MNTGAQYKRILTVLLRIGLEHTVTVFEQHKTVNTADSIATVVG
jgi:hypothetical protein